MSECQTQAISYTDLFLEFLFIFSSATQRRFSTRTVQVLMFVKAVDMNTAAVKITCKAAKYVEYWDVCAVTSTWCLVEETNGGLQWRLSFLKSKAKCWRTVRDSLCPLELLRERKKHLQRLKNASSDRYLSQQKHHFHLGRDFQSRDQLLALKRFNNSSPERPERRGNTTTRFLHKSVI